MYFVSQSMTYKLCSYLDGENDDDDNNNNSITELLQLIILHNCLEEGN